MVGLPGVGKTTSAKQLAASERALRLTPDEWMAPLFGESQPGNKRDVLEGRLLWVAREVLLTGGSVVLDFGCWSADERYAVRAVTELAGAEFRLQYLSLPEEERRARCAQRWRETPEETFPMTDEDQEGYLTRFEPPSPDELAGVPAPDPPRGHDTWSEWAADRWPSFPGDCGQATP